MSTFKYTAGGDYDSSNSATIHVTSGPADVKYDGSASLSAMPLGDLTLAFSANSWETSDETLPRVDTSTSGVLLDFSGSNFGATFTGGTVGDVLIGGSASDYLDGGAGNDSLSGNQGMDLLGGGNGTDTLNGGAGVDDMYGGAGADVYMVDDSTDSVNEDFEGGDVNADTVYASVSYGLSSNVEKLILTGSAISGTGNADANEITGNNQMNTIDGGAGADIMTGGNGDDYYYVDDANDVINEDPWAPPRNNVGAPGIDTVRSLVSYTLGENVENLVLDGTAIMGTGNDLDNNITGNDENNTISGGTGADTMAGRNGDDFYLVDNTGDVVVELSDSIGRDFISTGTDTVSADVNFTLSSNVENLILTGSATVGMGNDLANNITGNNGNNTLNGGADADSLMGGNGDDVYILDNSQDKVIEFATPPGRIPLTAGNDTVRASVSFTLAANVENLTLTGTASTGYGNELDNEIKGNGAINFLRGYAGDDTMLGMGGNDTINGGAGDDTLVGGFGADRIYGGNGDDVITGGRGKDALFMQLGEDRLVFDDGDTGASRAFADDVFFFNGKGGDRIDLTAVDANENLANDQDFEFIGNDKFHGVAGELRYVQQGTDTWLVGDTDGDKRTDLTIHFNNLVSFKDEFILG